MQTRKENSVYTVAGFAATVAALAAGSAAVAYSFSLAASGENRDPMFILFWLGMLIGTIPLIIWIARKSSTPIQRGLALMGLAEITTLPKILRSLSGPLFHDEYAHLRATEDILNTGVTNGFNSIVTPVPLFPGLHGITAWVSSITGLDVWTSAEALVSVAHLAGLLGIYVLIRTLGLSARGAAIGAAVYITNANWMYFHSQFSYESLGLPVAIWTVIIAIYAIRAARPRRWIFLAALAPMAYSLASIHHLSTFGLLAILLLIAVWSSAHSIFVKKYHYAMMSWLTVAAVSLFAFIRLQPSLQLLTEYLGAPVNKSTGNAVTLIKQFFGLEESTGATRQLFDGSSLPMYEKILSYGATLTVSLAIAFITYIWVSNHWNKLPKFKTFNIPSGSPIRNAFIGLSYAYIISVPLILSAAGAESARRSWGYSFIGVAVVFALIVDMFEQRAETFNKGNKFVGKGLTASFVGIFTILLIGGVAAGVNESYRFPEPQTNVNDITASTAEAKMLGKWFAENSEVNTWVMTDRYSGLQVASTGRQLIAPPSKAFPYWEMYWKNEAPKVSIIAGMKAVGVEYIVVDTRMDDIVPDMGFWFAGGEPRYPRGGELAPAEPNSLDKFDYLPWMHKVFTTENYSVYKINLDLYNPYETERIIKEHAVATTNN